MKNIIKIILLGLLLCFLVLWDAYTYAYTIQSEISNHVIRLHVIANSDSEIDQELKLKVRDAILSYMKGKSFNDFDSAYQTIQKELGNIQNIAQQTLLSYHCYKDVNVELGKYYFPFKTYDTLSFPSGMYHALRIKIGNAQGHNWWCVMYPSLCFSEEICNAKEASEELENSLHKETFDIIAGSIKMKLKIVDLFQRMHF